MSSDNGCVLVYAELDDCRLCAGSLQLVGKARELADRLGVPVEVIFIGHGVEKFAKDLIAAGADRIHLADDESLALYQPQAYCEILVELCSELRPEIFLVTSSHSGRELAPLAAARLHTGLTAHCVDLRLKEGTSDLEQLIPAYGGLLSILCPQKRPQMATVSKGVFASPAADADRVGQVVSLDLPDNASSRVRTLEVVIEQSDSQPLETASIVVAGGAGAGDEEGWRKIGRLAEVLGAALGCTRPAVDEGWAPLDTMIGQSGKTVSPELYIGVGISGDLQHTVGVSGAKVMVAINSDAKSPVFEQVDLGIVDDCREFLPVLIEKIEEYKDQCKIC
jgi:electron transfer flavoprotein alpha subunit